MNTLFRRWLPFTVILFVVLVLFAYLLTNRSGSVYVPDTANPAKIYSEVCAGCHGTRGQGSGLFYPALDSDKMEQTKVEQIINEGSILMPQFKKIRGDTLQQLVKYVLEKKFVEKENLVPKKRHFTE